MGCCKVPNIVAVHLFTWYTKSPVLCLKQAFIINFPCFMRIFDHILVKHLPVFCSCFFSLQLKLKTFSMSTCWHNKYRIMYISTTLFPSVQQQSAVTCTTLLLQLFSFTDYFHSLPFFCFLIAVKKPSSSVRPDWLFSLKHLQENDCFFCCCTNGNKYTYCNAESTTWAITVQM